MIAIQHIHESYPLQEDDVQAEHDARLFHALAHPVRLRLLHILATHEDMLAVHELVEWFQLEQPTISHHLSVLYHAGILGCRKSGLHHYYHVRRDTLGKVRGIIEQFA